MTRKLQLRSRASVGSVDVATLSFDGQRLVLQTDISAPPGAPLAVWGEDSPGEVALKSVRCRRVDPTGFEIEARVVNLSRAQRQWLSGLVDL